MRNAIEGSEVHFGIPGPWRSPPFRFAPSMILPFLLIFTIHLDLFAISSDQQERFPVFRLSSTFLSVSEQRTHHDDIRAAWLGSAMFASEGGYVFVGSIRTICGRRLHHQSISTCKAFSDS